MLGRLKVDDRAALHSVRALMADAEHLAPVRAAAQRARRLHRAQPRDQADDLRGADVENRQDRALARGNLTHARRERAEAHGCAAFLRRMSVGPFGGRFLRQPHEHPPGRAKVEREHVAIEKAGLALEAQQGRDRGLRVDFGQLDLDAGFQLEVPAALADQDPGLDARPELLHRVEQGGEFAHARIRALSDDERQVDVPAVAARRRSGRRPRRWREPGRPSATRRRACARRSRRRSDSGRVSARSPA